ncbi:MAG: hypothetical protein ACYSR0_08720 [Planctomycetota bacterium]
MSYVLIQYAGTDDTTMTQPGIKLLGTQYSERLRRLYEQVSAAYEKPIKIEAIAGKMDNTIEIRPSDILIRLHPGSSEDNVAHELLHAILKSEGYPQIFSLQIIPLSQAIGNIIRADLDHLIINQRLRSLGYAPHSGFLKNADSFKKFLSLQIPEGQNQRAVFQISTIHELIKFHLYIKDANAERAILQKYPEIKPYWEKIKNTVKRLKRKASPADVWRVAEVLNTVADNICEENNADFRFSDIIGFEPVQLTSTELKQKASRIFEESLQRIPGSKGVLLRTFVRRSHMLVGASIVPVGIETAQDLELPVTLFIKQRNISFLKAS